MLVVCNGAFKSGSTWVYELVNSILKVKEIKQSEVPSRYSPNRSPAMKIAERSLKDFIDHENITDNWYLTKAHFFQVETLSREYPTDACFLFIERDLRDAVVSHYHHFLIYKKSKMDFNTYYKLVGRYKAYEIWLFNQRCRQYFGNENFFQFETMKVDVKSTISKICGILGIAELTEEELQQVISETSLDSLRERAKSGDNTHYHGAGKDNSKLFRKGKTGEYSKYFNASNLKDIEKIMSGHFPFMSKLYYDILFTYRRKLLR